MRLFSVFFLIFIFLGNELPEGWRGGSLQAEISHVSNLPQTGKFPSTIVSCSSRLFTGVPMMSLVSHRSHGGTPYPPTTSTLGYPHHMDT